MSRKFVKKPVVIEAIQWTGDNQQEISEFCNHEVRFEGLIVIIYTLKCNYWVSKGDYIIKGIKGEFYSCQSDILEATYDLYEDEA